MSNNKDNKAPLDITSRIENETKKSIDRYNASNNVNNENKIKEHRNSNNKNSKNNENINKRDKKISNDAKRVEEIDSYTKKQYKKYKRAEKRKRKSFIYKVLYQEQRPHIALLLLELLVAIILDSLVILKNMILGAFALLIVAGFVATFIVYIKIKPIYDEYDKFAEQCVEESTYDTFMTQEASYIYDKKGDLLVKLKGDQDSNYIAYNDIPPFVVDAFVAVEDRSFWDNPGVDLKGIIRVLYRFVVTKGEEEHGASTITQQLARNVFLTHEVSLERKGKEMLIALKLTKKYTKRDIMEFYVNNICYSNAFYGISAAANGYFNKDVDELSLSQLAYLCAIPNSPEYYNPYKHPERAVERRDKILKDMVEEGLISVGDYEKAIAEEIIIERPTYTFNNYETTFAIDCAVKWLMKESGFEFKYTYDDKSDYQNYKNDYEEAYEAAKYKLSTGGYKVYTSLDKDIQNKLQNVLDTNLEFDSEIDESNGIYALQGAITCIDNESGKIVAVIGGRSQDTEGVYSLNRAFQSYRQPGSTIKPLVVYTPSLISGMTPDSIVQNISVSAAKERGVDVQSLKGDQMTLRSALEQSKNGVAWQLFDRLGARTALSYITNMKFSNISPDDYYNSASLGGLTYGVTTVEMASAYATLENHGYYRDATCITKIINSDGVNIYTEEPEVDVYRPSCADTMTDMMKGVLTNGTAKGLGWYNKTKTVAACKTGTTNDSKDGWLCGYTPYYTIAVWVGYDTPRTLNNLYGATYPGQIWRDSMLSLIEDKDVVDAFNYSEEYSESDLYNINGNLPESAYNIYLPGRDDSEVLSDGYTVYDYRTDRVIGEQVQSIIDRMYNLSKSSPTFQEDMLALYNQGQAYVDTIYSVKYTAEMQGKLSQAYSNIIGKLP